MSPLPECTEIEEPTPKTAQSIYKCTKCEKSFKSMASWTRHEKEAHEDISFHCMPDGAIEITAHGRQCALCGKDPTEDHMKSHNIDECTQVKQVFKRGYELKDHLMIHKINKKTPRSATLVTNWQRVPEKRAWACGFCRCLFHCLSDYHKHIANKHYEEGEVREWDHVKVILGLLSQDFIDGPWKRLLASRFRVQSISLKWSKSKTGRLQTRLELGQEDGETLAQAALDCAIYDTALLRHTTEPPGKTPVHALSMDNLRPPVPPKVLPTRSRSQESNKSSQDPLVTDGLIESSIINQEPFDPFQTRYASLPDAPGSAWLSYDTHRSSDSMQLDDPLQQARPPDYVNLAELETHRGSDQTPTVEAPVYRNPFVPTQ